MNRDALVSTLTGLALAITAAQEEDRLRKQLLRREKDEKYVPPVKIFSTGDSSDKPKLKHGQQKILDSYRAMLMRIDNNTHDGIKSVGKIVANLREWEKKFNNYNPVDKIGFFGKNEFLQKNVAPVLASMAGAMASRHEAIEIVRRRGDGSELGQKSGRS